jgi:HEAT repeat protein
VHLTTGKEIRTFRGHYYGVLSVAFSPDGKYALSGSGDKTLKLWEVSTGKEIRTFTEHLGRGTSEMDKVRYYLANEYWDQLIKIGKPAVNYLIQALEDEDYPFRIRRGIAKVLGDIGPDAKEAVPNLIKVLENDPDAEARDNAAFALGNIGDRRAVDALMKAALVELFWIRQESVEALGKIGDPRAIDTIIRAGFSDWKENIILPGLAVEALLKFGEKAVEPMIKAAYEDDRPLTKSGNPVAIEALGLMREKRAFDALVYNLSYKPGYWEEWRAQYKALTALGLLKDPRAVEPIISSFNNDPWYKKIEALGEIGDSIAVEFLIEVLNSEGAYGTTIRSEAATSLGKIANKEALEGLTLRLKNEKDSKVRGAIEEAIAEISDRNKTKE